MYLETDIFERLTRSRKPAALVASQEDGQGQLPQQVKDIDDFMNSITGKQPSRTAGQ